MEKMTNSKHWIAGGVAGLVLLVVGVVESRPMFAQSSAPEGVVAGEEVSYEFRSPLVNGRGVTRLDDLRGKPLLVEFWGTR
jgi:hypothetical protein